MIDPKPRPQPTNPANWPPAMNLNQSMYFAREVEPYMDALEQRLIEREAEVERINEFTTRETQRKMKAWGETAQERKVTAILEAALREYANKEGSGHMTHYWAEHALAEAAKIREAKS